MTNPPEVRSRSTYEHYRAAQSYLRTAEDMARAWESAYRPGKGIPEPLTLTLSLAQVHATLATVPKENLQ